MRPDGVRYWFHRVFDTSVEERKYLPQESPPMPPDWHVHFQEEGAVFVDHDNRAASVPGSTVTAFEQDLHSRDPQRGASMALTLRSALSISSPYTGTR